MKIKMDINLQLGRLIRSLIFEGCAWTAYEELHQKDQKLHKMLRRLIKEMLRGDPGKGTGKPEQLKHNLSGLWSRRISQKDRVVYKFDEKFLHIFAIGGHYDQF